jgi:CheY-like chemotaxis protein
MNSTVKLQQVLLIDDDDSVRELALMGLEGMTDWKIELAASASEGLEKAKKSHPDLILLDFVMPDMNGLEAFAKLQEDPELKDIPVILMTGKTEPKEVEQFLKSGLSGVITKPFDPVTLSEQIEEILAHRD